MHVENESVEFVTVGEPKYEEIIEEYEEEVLVLEGAPEPLATDFADTPPAQGKPQGKPQCLTLICEMVIEYIYIYVMCIYVTGMLWKPHA